MSHTHASPALERFLESVVRQLPREAVEAMADLRPPFDEHVDDAVADEVIHLFQAKAKAAIHESLAGPLPDEPDFNEETKQVLRDAREGKGLVRYDNWDELFADLGM
ncbi:hypothetical protein [Paludisphaera borealis]|uniref:Uncharacterized protein n=1 Tax=Paludisphaera borealis TaxID=1387353 RepID=A0A1U7CKL8_9BACT|nr:hypothetical protein [Paludisphaera borealis]APW59423.1 hypothetical protein BSF38_00846 [Paludisphaera borealis]